jgi:aminoglycoside phosphotransferase family enzyme
MTVMGPSDELLAGDADGQVVLPFFRRRKSTTRAKSEYMTLTILSVPAEPH